MPTKIPFQIIAVAVLSCSSSNAALLVYEGFDGYTTANLGGQSATGTGFSGAWTSRHDGTTYDAYHQPSATGLSFNFLATSGGALPFSTSATRLTGIALNPTSLPAGGFTLYSSYLVRMDSFGASDSGVGVRLTSSTVTDSVAHLGTFADSRANSNLGVSYDQFFAPNYNQAGASLALGQTFVIISSYTAINDGATSGTARSYALNQDQYASYIASTQSFADYAASATIGSGAGQIWSSASHTATFNSTFDNSDFFQILTRFSTGAIDEIRYGTSYADVLPVPEPSAALLLGAAAIVGAVRRRR